MRGRGSLGTEDGVRTKGDWIRSKYIMCTYENAAMKSSSTDKGPPGDKGVTTGGTNSILGYWWWECKMIESLRTTV